MIKSFCQQGELPYSFTYTNCHIRNRFLRVLVTKASSTPTKDSAPLVM